MFVELYVCVFVCVCVSQRFTKELITLCSRCQLVKGYASVFICKCVCLCVFGEGGH